MRCLDEKSVWLNDAADCAEPAEPHKTALRAAELHKTPVTGASAQLTCRECETHRLEIEMDSAEFKRIFLPYHRLLYRVAFQLEGDAADAEDLMQDFYLKLWQRRDDLGTEARNAEYLVVMMRNLYYNQQRAKWDRFLDEMGENDLTADDLPDLRVEAHEQMALLRRLVDQLPPKEAKLARLRFLEQMDYAEIQAATGMEYGAVRTAVMRVRVKLAEQIKRINDYGQN